MKKKWRRANNYDPYKRLAAAIIHKACRDYSHLCQRLESPYLKADVAEGLEVEGNNVEAFLLDPLNVYVNYLGIDSDVIEDYIMLRGKEAEQWPAALNKSINGIL